MLLMLPLMLQQQLWLQGTSAGCLAIC